MNHLYVKHRPKPETRLFDITVTYPNVTKCFSSNTIGGCGTAAKAAEEVKDAWYNKRAIIPAGMLVPVAFETNGTLGARGDAYLRDVVRNYVRPVTWLDAPADHGRRYSIFLRRLRELHLRDAAAWQRSVHPQVAGQLRPQERSA